MNFYFENYFIKGNEPLYWAFVGILVAIIVFTIFAVRKETKK